MTRRKAIKTIGVGMFFVAMGLPVLAIDGGEKEKDVNFGYATGGLVKNPTLCFIGENKRETVIPSAFSASLR